MLRAAAQFLAEMASGAPPRWLSLLGTSGAGKTFLADLILAAVKRHQLTRSTVIRGTGVSLNADYRIRWEIALNRALDRREWGWLDDLCNAKFAVVDEVGGDLIPRTISAPKLAMLAERRVGKWSVLTGNVSMQTIKEQFDARISSRMLRGGSVVVDVDVVDFNLR